MIKRQKGQVVVLLLLVMVIALAVGLSTINRSTLEVSTSRKSEDSSRAFSAAEAGMERVIQENKDKLGEATNINPTLSLGNDSGAVIATSGLPKPGLGLAYPPFGKESFAQFWLVDPTNMNRSDSHTYLANSFDIYFGDPSPNGNTHYYETHPDEKPAIEVSTIYSNGSKYLSLSKYFDSYSITNPRSGFTSCDQPGSTHEITVNNNTTENFYCKATVDISSIVSGNSFPIMVRVRILYSSLSHSVAIYPVSGNIPKQANIYTSTGTSGNVQRTLKVFSQKSVMPQFFNYALFSAAELVKGT